MWGNGSGRTTRVVWTSKRRRLIAFGLLCAGVATVVVLWRGSAAVPSAPACVTREGPISAAPATPVSDSAVAGTAGRLDKAVLRSPAMGADVPVFVLLPRAYARHPGERFPVLYLLHGGGASYRAWVDQGVGRLIDREAAADRLAPFITVMPDGGSNGYFSDWAGRPPGAPGSPPAYATYFMDELIPWIDRHYRTRPMRTARAIAGLSMGGFGAMSFAARYPDRFVVAGSFSGAVDTELDYPHHTNGLSAGYTDACMWGDPIRNVVAWRAVDPTYLAPNLAGVSLYLASGNGEPGDPSFGIPSHASTTEAFLWQMNRRFAATLHAARVPFTAYFYGPGSHTWPYWLRDLRHFLPLMEHAFTHPLPAPPRVAFDYRTDSTTAEIWGWTFAITHRGREFTYFRDVSARGLTITGQGRLTVTTAPLYPSRRSYTVTLTGTPSRQVRPRRDRRLQFTVDLGTPRPTTGMRSAPRASPSTIVVRISPTNHRHRRAHP